MEAKGHFLVGHIHQSSRLRGIHDLGVFAFVLPGLPSVEAVTVSVAFTLLGAVGFFVGSLLMLPETAEAAAERRVEATQCGFNSEACPAAARQQRRPHPKAGLRLKNL